ncbi:CocE/NonD family hydrolase C-terminal non-catalytic domain-containing protein [Numidum massiliense]|uniref:CocE/NonD family hydrolase C-terminal non-catalytic domain-containing protein n=1 Tax=Numidum massiliense TaxID=1522315 RepID=UPI00164D1A62|nr:CocE/NonD family hydrolase C-terminal non-catalytic domain-containing protein [Numidum massiliense]
MALNLWAETNAADIDFVVQVSDVAPDGTSTAVTAGYLNAQRSKSRSTPEPITPGKIEPYQIDILPTSYVFKKGHRIRLSIAGGTKAHQGQGSPQGPYHLKRYISCLFSTVVSIERP